MAQQDLPAKIAQDFESMIPAPVRKAFGFYSDAVDKVKGAAKKTDPAWHDDMVKKANASFAAQQVGKIPPKKKAVKKGVQKKAVVKRKVAR